MNLMTVLDDLLETRDECRHLQSVVRMQQFASPPKRLRKNRPGLFHGGVRSAARND